MHLSATHDIQDVSITSPLPGVIRVTGKFIQGSTDIGVMMAIQTNSELYNFHTLHRQENQLHFNDFISNVAGGRHSVSIFVLEGNGLPFNRSAIIPQKVIVIEGKAAESDDVNTCRDMLACTYTCILL